jgi:hypothetical protein
VLRERSTDVAAEEAAYRLFVTKRDAARREKEKM